MPDHTDDTVLQLVNVSKSFGPVNVIKDVTLSVRRGQVQALLGENGAGKSTLIKMIAGVHQPDSGKILSMARGHHRFNQRPEAHGIATIHQELNLRPRYRWPKISCSAVHRSALAWSTASTSMPRRKRR